MEAAWNVAWRPVAGLWRVTTHDDNVFHIYQLELVCVESGHYGWVNMLEVLFMGVTAR